jgi:N-ethylmaleimide reductase
LSNLFESMGLGNLKLSNRMVMAPMSRHRARLDGVPTAEMLEYYRQRASAGLIISEGTCPSPMAFGYLFSPGIFTQEQVDHWRLITDAVHAAGSHIFCQFMHCGRLSDPLILPNGADPIAPSAVRASPDGLYPPNCPQPRRPFPRPRALTTQEVYGVVEEYAAAAGRALEAGFDGVEIHGGNGYLPMQFLATNVNLRDDEFGGSVPERCKFILDLVDAVAAVCGADRVGVRIHPGQKFADIDDSDPKATCDYLAPQLSMRRIAYLHLSQRDVGWDVIGTLRQQFEGVIIGNGGLSRPTAGAAIAEGRMDLAAFGKAFLANPDLVDRYRNGWTLNPANAGAFYTQGAEGYLDYPRYDPQTAANQLAADAVVA